MAGRRDMGGKQFVFHHPCVHGALTVLGGGMVPASRNCLRLAWKWQHGVRSGTTPVDLKVFRSILAAPQFNCNVG